MKNKLLLILNFCFVAHLFAQDTGHNLSLNEAISFALENNRTVKNAARDIEAAEKQKWETTTIGFPQISAGIDYQNNIDQSDQL